MNASKKKKVRIIIAVITVVFVIGTFFLINPIRSLIAINSMTPIETGEIMTDIYAIKNQYVNLFLVKCDDTYIMFDAGVDNEATKSALDSFGVTADDISAVFLTHTDYDHVGTVSLFPSAEIYMADSNREFLEAKKGLSRSKAFLEMERGYVTIKDDETVPIADVSIQCIFTPGHTDGSASYVVDGKYLFTGDTMNLKNGKAIMFNSVFNMSDDEQKNSIRKLSGMDGIEAVFTMHTGYSTDFEMVFKGWNE